MLTYPSGVVFVSDKTESPKESKRELLGKLLRVALNGFHQSTPSFLETCTPL